MLFDPAGILPARQELPCLAEDIVRTVVASAKSGDMTAAKIVLDRLCPVRRGACVTFEIPDGDAATSLNGVLAAVARGQLSPDEGQAVAAIIENKRKAVEMEQLEERLAAVEKRLTERNHR